MSHLSDESEFSFTTAFLIGIIIVLIVILVWYYWAAYVYRYSSERIADKLLKKYPKKPTDDQSILAKNGMLNGVLNNKIASADITIQDKGTDNVAQSSEVFSLAVKDSCSPLDKTCISL